nr:helix-turn-helix domain-containing protein [Kibdelosporangium phytohabitans]
MAAARALVDEVGHEFALDEAARRAGVSNATLYRHFPTRADLLVAVYADKVRALCHRGTELLAVASPLDGFWASLDEFVMHIATNIRWLWP